MALIVKSTRGKNKLKAADKAIDKLVSHTGGYMAEEEIKIIEGR